MATMAVLTLASFGGCFTGRHPGRKITSLPLTEDEMDEELFLNGNSDYTELEDFGDWESLYYRDAHDDQPKNDLSFAQRLLAMENLTSDQVRAAAQVFLDNPELLVELYAKGIRPEGIYDRDYRSIARKRIFGLTQDIFTVMLTLSSEKKINRSLADRRDEETHKTLLSCLAQFARYEMQHKCRHLTAATIMKALGHDDVFARYLD